MFEMIPVVALGFGYMIEVVLSSSEIANCEWQELVCPCSYFSEGGSTQQTASLICTEYQRCQSGTFYKCLVGLTAP